MVSQELAAGGKHVAAEVLLGGGGDTGLVLALVDRAAQVAGLRTGQAFAVGNLLGETLGAAALCDVDGDGAAEHVIGVPGLDGAVVPGCQRLAGGVGGQPVLARVHAEVVDLRAGQVVVPGQDLPAERVGDGTRVALDVEAEDGRVLPAGPIVGHGAEDPAQGVEVRQGRRGGVGGSLRGGVGVSRTGCRRLPGRVPAAGQDGVVLVRDGLAPGADLRRPEGAVRVVNPDGPAERVISSDRRDAPVDQVGLVVVGGTGVKERLVRLHRVGFVVVHDPAAADPPRGSRLQDEISAGVGDEAAVAVPLGGRARFGLRFGHGDAPGAVAVGVGLQPGRRRVLVPYPGLGVHPGWLGVAGIVAGVGRPRLERRQVVVQAGGRVVASSRFVGAGVEVVTFIGAIGQQLSHAGGGHHHAQRVVTDAAAVGVGVGDQPRLQHPVVG